MGRHFRRRRIARAAVPALLSIVTMLGALTQAFTGDWATALLILAAGTATIAYSIDNLREIDRLQDKLMNLRLRRLDEDIRRTPAVTDCQSAAADGVPARIIPLAVEGPAADQLAAILANALRRQAEAAE